MRAALLIAACLLTTSPALAWPFARPAPQLRQIMPVRCAAPTLEQCKSPSYRRTACGKLQMARARVDEEAPCNVLFRAAAEAASSSIPVERVVLPPKVTGASGVATAPQSLSLGECTPLGASRTCAHVQAVSHKGMYAHGGNTLAFAGTLSAAAYGPPSNTTSEASIARFLRLFQKMHWMSTPLDEPFRVRTCGEYLFEKYFDYSLFEEQAAIAAFDPRAVYTIAYGPAQSRTSIGTRSMQGIGLAQYDNTPFASQIAFPQNQIKNVFFSLPLAPDARGAPGEGMPSFLAPCAGRSQVHPDTIWLEDRALYNIVKQRPHHDESFVWHKQQNDFLDAQGYLDEELYAFDKLKGTLAGLLEERAFFENAYYDMLLYMATIGDGQTAVAVGVPNDPYEGVVNPWEAMAYAVAAHQAGVDVAHAGQQTASGGFSNNTWAADVTMDPVAVQAYLDGPFAASMCVANPWDNFFTYVGAKLSGIDAKIENVLHQAQDAGCLDVNNPTPCDWSPALFAQRVTDLYVNEREADYGRCLEKTQGNIDKIRARTFHVGSNTSIQILNAHGLNCSTRQTQTGAQVFWSDNPRMTDEYFDCIRAWIKANVDELVAHQGSPFGPDGKVIVGKGTSDKLALGNDDFGGQLEYEARFGVNGFDVIGDPNNPAIFHPEKLSHSISGKVGAVGRVFGNERELFFASMKTTMDLVDVDMRVNGVELYVDAPEQVFQGPVAPVMDGRETSHTFVEGKTVVPVMGIPVTVRGGISGEVGLKYTATAIESPTILNDQLKGTFEPFSSVDAFASASVDAVIIEVGVKGNVTIVRVSLPYGAGTHVYVPPGMMDSAIDVDGAAKMKLNMLSGNLRAFGEIDFGLYSESAQVPIFSWGGITYEKTLWADAYSVSVEPLFIVQRDGFEGL